MRVFITGASGYIGNAVAKAFRRNGHSVFGLIRSEDWVKKLSKHEIHAVVGNIREPNTYLQELHKADVIVHAAFEHSNEVIEVDHQMIESVLQIAKDGKSCKKFIYTSGVWVYGNCYPNIATEETPLHPIKTVEWRANHEKMVIKHNCNNLHTLILRPGCIYGGQGGLDSLWFSSAKKEGVVEVIGDGENHWAHIHVQDLARGYVKAAERDLSGISLNLTNGIRTPKIQDLALAVARGAGIEGKVKNISPQEAEKKHGHLVQGLLINQIIDNQLACRLLNWQPKHKPFIEEVELYYAAWQASQ